MAGWAAYIKNLLDTSDCITKAAIVGCSDGEIWAKSEKGDGHEEFVPQAGELTKFVALFEQIQDVPQHGFTLEGTKYIVPLVEENLIFAKKEKTGIIAVKTDKTVLIACYQGESAQGLACRTAVERLGLYLQEVGY